jgi:hypothetical protein
VYPNDLPERIHIFKELHIACCNLKLPQPAHAGRERLRRLIARLRLCRDKQPPIYTSLLFLKNFSFLSNRSGMAVRLGSRLRVVSSGIVELFLVSYVCDSPRRMLVTCLFSRSCCSLTFSIRESRASKSDEVASRSSM